MTAEVLTRPLNLLARYELACIRPAKKHIYGTRRPLAISSHTTQRIIPDFLLPAFATGINLGSPLFHVSSTLHKRAVSHAKHVEQRREFSASPATKAVVVAANPRRDEDGNEMLIDITARAANVGSPRSASPLAVVIANIMSSVLRRSCRKIPIQTLHFESLWSPVDATVSNTSCPSRILQSYLPTMTPYSKQVTALAQKW